MNMHRKGGALALLLAGLLIGTTLVPAGSQAAGTSAGNRSASAAHKSVLASDFGKARSHIVGSFGQNGVVTGTFTPRRFKVNDDGDLRAIGKLKATLTRANGNVVGTTTQLVNVPVATIEGSPLPDARALRAPSCNILNLVLGPLDLDLLGLQVHLDRVVLTIIGATGTGNLLGNLLCAVAGLLDTNGALTQISQILNSILAILRL